jgi:adenosylcobinamide-GDP ribazoletransferase
MSLDALREEAGRLVAALLFFTRLPLPAALTALADHSQGLNRSAVMFAPAGALIGLLLGALLLALCAFLPIEVAAWLVVGAGLLLTGALHEDGLADCADGWGAGNNAEKALSIMRDSRIGAWGAAALVLSIGLRWAALAAMSPWAAAMALAVSHAAGRGAIAIALARYSYARPTGTGSLVAGGIENREFGFCVAATAIACGLFGGFAGLVAAAAAFAAAWFFIARFAKRIGGYTGDALGAMEQLGEIAALVALVAFWGAGE